MPPIYLDYNATTPLAPEVIGAMRPYLETHFGNPSSSHWYGLQTQKAIANARRQLAALLGCLPEELIFTSGGSESNNLAIKGVAWALRDRGTHIVTSSVEHPAVSEVCRHLAQHGFSVTVLPVDETGRVSLTDVQDALSPRTTLVTIMHANNEVGTIQPIAEIAELTRQRGIVFHTDAAQSVGKIPTRVDALGVDLLSVAGHKLYAPKGVGALYVRRGTGLMKQIHGANHESNMRAGTENVLEIVGLGRAAELATNDLERSSAHAQRMRDRLQAGLQAELPTAVVHGSSVHRLPNTLSIGFVGIEANTLLDELADEVAASAGAACHTDSIDVSAVLEAMRVDLRAAMGTVRFSTGRMTTAPEVEHAIRVVVSAVKRLSGEETMRAFGPETTVPAAPDASVSGALERPRSVAVGEASVVDASVPGALERPRSVAVGEASVVDANVPGALEMPRSVAVGEVASLPDVGMSDHTVRPVDDTAIRLTQFTHGLGCACKLRPQQLEEVLAGFEPPGDDNVLVGTDTSDDAAVYQLREDLAVVQTVDFFTPIVDDPFLFGAIAAANSLSDIYAMGARPLFGLNVVGFPDKRLPLSVLKRILAGALSKAQEAGISIIGGHTIEDSEPKYGLVVTGVIHPAHILRNRGARPGDAIVLTKPLGTGIIATAMKRRAADADVSAAAIRVMCELNRAAAETIEDMEIHACTDVTGFGLLGHLWEVTRSSAVDAEVWFDRVPIIDGTLDLALAGLVPGGSVNNLQYVEEGIDWEESLSNIQKLVVCDAQTSGGLLFTTPEDVADEVVERLSQKGLIVAHIGRITRAGAGRISVRARKA